MKRMFTIEVDFGDEFPDQVEKQSNELVETLQDFVEEQLDGVDVEVTVDR